MKYVPTITATIPEFLSYSLCSLMGSALVGILAGPPAPSCILVAAVGERAYIVIVPKRLMGACENSSSQKRGLREKQNRADSRNNSSFHG